LRDEKELLCPFKMSFIHLHTHSHAPLSDCVLPEKHVEQSNNITNRSTKEENPSKHKMHS
jgi:hypothetical protein